MHMTANDSGMPTTRPHRMICLTSVGSLSSASVLSESGTLECATSSKSILRQHVNFAVFCYVDWLQHDLLYHVGAMEYIRQPIATSAQQQT